MSAALKILVYFGATLLLGALLSPPLFWAGDALGSFFPSLRWLRETDFQRYFDRAVFAAALTLLWPAARSLHIGGWRGLGLASDPHGVRRLLAGFALAAGALWLFGGLLWQLGVYRCKGLPAAGTLAAFLLTALAVAALEEGFFRGALLGLVRRNASDGAALAFVTALFGVLHFLKPPDDPAPDSPVAWFSGFRAMARAGWQFGDPRLLAGGLVTLLLVGLILGAIRLHTRSLWLPIGLHAGWIFALKSFSRSSRHVAEPNFLFGKDMITGLGPVCLLLLTGGLLWAGLRRQPPPPRPLAP